MVFFPRPSLPPIRTSAHKVCCAWLAIVSSFRYCACELAKAIIIGLCLSGDKLLCCGHTYLFVISIAGHVLLILNFAGQMLASLVSEG